MCSRGRRSLFPGSARSGICESGISFTPGNSTPCGESRRNSPHRRGGCKHEAMSNEIATHLMESIERQDWLEPVEESVQNAVSKAFEQAGRGVQDALNGVWLGHPLHPVITDIPVGAWTTALLFDIACMGSRKRKYRDAADVAVGLGLAGSALAAITGLADWKDIKGKDRRAGIVHATLNTLVASLYTGSLIARRNRARGLGQALGILGWGVMLTSAWIGGELVYKYRDGVDQSNSTELPDDW